MDKTLSTLRAEVKRNIQQSSNSDINDAVDDALNVAYEKAWKAISWEEAVRWNYTFESVVDQEDYDLPDDFGEELFVTDIATGHKLRRLTNREC